MLFLLLIFASWFAIATHCSLFYFLQAKQAEWLELYLPAVVKGLNDHRNYLSTEFRKVALEYMEGTKGIDVESGPIEPMPLPTPEAIAKMTLRDFSADVPDGVQMDKEAYNLHVFEFYITKLLAVAAGG